MGSEVRLASDGPFSLASSIDFLEGFVPAALDPAGERRLRMAFPVEGDWRSVGVAVRQEETGEVVAEVVGDASVERVAAQLARILSLDVDGAAFPDVAGRDAVVGRLQDRYPGLRPVCFWSPYEAAVWSVLSHRTRIVAAAAVKRRLAVDTGETVEVAGRPVAAFPSPERLLAVEEIAGMDPRKTVRLHAVAEAALAGELDGATLRALPPTEALALLQRLPGIGPFFAELILLRGAGEPDTFPSGERRLHEAMAELYHMDRPAASELAAIAERWRPYRTWVSVLIRHWREDVAAEITGHFT